jgi:hypothetical protein
MYSPWTFGNCAQFPPGALEDAIRAQVATSRERIDDRLPQCIDVDRDPPHQVDPDAPARQLALSRRRRRHAQQRRAIQAAAAFGRRGNASPLPLGTELDRGRGRNRPAPVLSALVAEECLVTSGWSRNPRHRHFIGRSPRRSARPWP